LDVFFRKKRVQRPVLIAIISAGLGWRRVIAPLIISDDTPHQLAGNTSERYTDSGWIRPCDTIAARFLRNERLYHTVLTRRVLENLLSNAIKHTPPGGPVRISITTRDGRVRFEVLDEGPGVPSTDRKKIFEKFGTVESRRNKKYHSTGLGLAFFKLAIEAQGGTIGVDPRAPEGSTFWFELPT
jgi:signal transduction histidine kinase